MLHCSIHDAMNSVLNIRAEGSPCSRGAGPSPEAIHGIEPMRRAAVRDGRHFLPPDPKEHVMSDAATSKSKTTKPSTPIFEIPKFEMPKFEMPKFEVPAAFREFAEKGVAQAKDTYEKVKAAAEEATDLLEDTYTTAAKGAADYNLKVIEAARTNTNAAFDYARELLDVKSLSEVLELSTAHAHRQFETLSEQTKELAVLAQKVATDTVEPIKSGVNKAFRKVA
jgi:phasin